MECHDFAPLNSPLFIPDSTLFQLADAQIETADIPVSMSSVTNGVQGKIAVSSDNFAVSGLSHHVMSTMTSLSPMVASQEIESNPDILSKEKDTSAITVTDADPALKAQCKSYLLLVLVDR